MNPDCQHVVELMDSYLSSELTIETNHLVLHHIATCQSCEAELKRRQRLRTLLRQSLDMPVDAERATRRVTQALDRDQRTWLRGSRWWAAAAAALIAAVVIAPWLARPVDAAAYDDSAGNHIACALAMPAEMTYDPARAAQSLVPPFTGLAESIGLTHGAYRVVDAHMCPYNGRDYAHVVLRSDTQTLSIFIEPALRGTLPATPLRTVLPGASGDVYSVDRLGYHVSATATPEHRLFVVSEPSTASSNKVLDDILVSALRFVHAIEH